MGKMSQVPNLVSNVTDNISRVNEGKKIKGKVVLMRKKVFDFTRFCYTEVDSGTEFVGPGVVSVQLVSASKADPGNGLAKVGKAAYLESSSIILLTQKATEEDQFAVHFDWDDEIGVPGAILVGSNHSAEFFLVSVTLEDIPNLGDVHFVCNSWVYPAAKCETDRIFFANKRIFFANKTYLPHETPGPLRGYRELELINLRGDGIRERQEWERIYDYETYNDLGLQDFDPDCSRPTLGGSAEYPYPRRGRTGRAPSTADPSKESRPLDRKTTDFYIPRDEKFSPLKHSIFQIYLIKSVSQIIRPALESAASYLSNEFDSFEEVDGLYEKGYPSDWLNFISLFIQSPVLKEIFRTDGERMLSFPTPQVIKVDKFAWMTDEEFAREMLAGVNPVLIHLLKEFPPKSKLDSSIYGDHTSKITKEQLEINLDGLTVDEALNRKRLFILDHHDAFMLYLRKINEGSNKAYATRTILFLKGDGTLRPVAIELSLPHPDGDKFGAVSRVCLPATQGAQSTIWLLAKAYVAVNDCGYHQLVSHWLNTHAVVEPFVIATNRHLSALHPIHKLLHPHYRDTMNINALARRDLINANGFIELSFLPGKYSLEMSSVVYKDWVFPDQALPRDLIKRGMAVEDSSSPHGLRLVIEDYPFAVDGLEIWFAIKTWVQEYVSYYYKSDDIVKKDIELQAWWKELVEVGHGDKRHETWWSKMQTLADLIETCTIIIWTSSALHAAVNFGQYTYGGYILNRPTLSRRLLPEEGTAEYDWLVNNPEKAFLKTITPKSPTLIDLSVIEILSRHTPDEYYLGDRDNDHWTSDSEPLVAFKRFGDKLAEIEKKLEKRNQDEQLRNRTGPVKIPYTLLYPSSKEGLTGKGIPNSISI